MELHLNLKMFDEGAAEAPAVEAPASGAPTVESAPEARDYDAEFDALVKGEFKDTYTRRTQSIIDKRFAETRKMEGRLKELDPILDVISARYPDIDATDSKALLKALKEDRGYYERAAAENGFGDDVDRYMEFENLRAENIAFKRASEEAQKTSNADQIYSKWVEQGEVCKAQFPTFELARECDPNNPTSERFLHLLTSGIDVTQAYKLVHMDEIISGSMAYTAQEVEKQTVNRIKNRAARPPEAGSTGAPGRVANSDPSTWDDKFFDDIHRRLANGERVVLGG